MGRHLFIVPGPGKQRHVCPGRASHITGRQPVQNTERVFVLGPGNVVAVRTGIRHVLFLIQRLHRGQSLLGGNAEARVGFHLQRVQRIRQRRRLRSFFPGDLLHDAIGRQYFFPYCFRNLFVQQSSFLVKGCFLFIRLPQSGEPYPLFCKSSFQLVIFAYLKTSYFFFPVDHQRQRRHLYPPDVPDGARGKLGRIGRIAAGQVDAYQPVRLLPRQSCRIQVFIFCIVFHGLKGPLHAHVVLGVDKKTLHLSFVIAIMQNFLNQQLSFPVRVARMDDHVRRFQQA